MTIYHIIAIAWLCAVVAAGVAHAILRERWTRTALAVLLAPLAGVVWAWGAWGRRQVDDSAPARLEEGANPEPPPALPPRRLPTSIATEDDHARHTLSTPELDHRSSDHERADWLDARAAELADGRSDD